MRAIGQFLTVMVAVAAVIALAGVLSARKVANRFVLPDGSVVRFTHVVVTNRLVIPFRGPKLLGVWSAPGSRQMVEVFSNQVPALVVAFELTGPDRITRFGSAPLKLTVRRPDATNSRPLLRGYGMFSSGPGFVRDVVVRADAFRAEPTDSSSIQVELERQDPVSSAWRTLLATNLSFGINSP